MASTSTSLDRARDMLHSSNRSICVHKFEANLPNHILHVQAVQTLDANGQQASTSSGNDWNQYSYTVHTLDTIGAKFSSLSPPGSMSKQWYKSTEGVESLHIGHKTLPFKPCFDMEVIVIMSDAMTQAYIAGLVNFHFTLCVVLTGETPEKIDAALAKVGYIGETVPGSLRMNRWSASVDTCPML